MTTIRFINPHKLPHHLQYLFTPEEKRAMKEENWDARRVFQHYVRNYMRKMDTKSLADAWFDISNAFVEDYVEDQDEKQEKKVKNETKTRNETTDEVIEQWKDLYNTNLGDSSGNFTKEVKLDAQYRQILDETYEAMLDGYRKFPQNDVNGLAVVAELGELMKALLDAPYENVRKEAIRTAATALRLAIEGDRSVSGWRKASNLDQLPGEKKSVQRRTRTMSSL